MNADVPPIIIWRLTDTKPGHQSQSQGLVNALARRLPCESFDIPVSGRLQPLFSWLSATWHAGRDLPMPDLIVGAGHRTHLHMLAAQKVYGGQTVVMMQPSLPLKLFDLCLIPTHDQYRGNGSFLETRGVLNPLRPEGPHHKDQSLIMIGGPSKHCNWDGNCLLSQVSQLCKHNPSVNYCLTTSRRTPADFIPAARQLSLANLSVSPFTETGPGWVAEQLAQSYSAWITEDSTSMVYEALTAHNAVGILNMPLKRENRVSRGVNQLIADNMVTRFDALGNYKKALCPVAGFTEADRCADWLMRRWLQTELALQPQLAFSR